MTSKLKSKPIEFSTFERQIICLLLYNSHKFKKLARKADKWFKESAERDGLLVEEPDAEK